MCGGGGWWEKEQNYSCWGRGRMPTANSIAERRPIASSTPCSQRIAVIVLECNGYSAKKSAKGRRKLTNNFFLKKSELGQFVP
jgi:hypothetical protein